MEDMERSASRRRSRAAAEAPPATPPIISTFFWLIANAPFLMIYRLIDRFGDGTVLYLEYHRKGVLSVRKSQKILHWRPGVLY